jgi:hypothetical protein
MGVVMNQLDEKFRYEAAKKKVEAIKAFYIHLVAYLGVNGFLLMLIYQSSASAETFWKAEHFSTAFFWGIGLVIHGFVVFGPDLVLGRNWEERKIREFMEQDKNNPK